MIYIVLIVALCSWYVWLWFKRDDTEPPVLSGNLPVIGHGLLFLGDSVATYNAMKKLSVEALQKGGVVKMYLGPVPAYGVTDPEDGLAVATNCIKKHYIYDFGRPLLGNGLLSADVATWKIHRKLLNPAFSQQVLCGFLDVFNSQARRLVDQFANHVGKEFDHEQYIRINNLETICTTAAGVDVSEYANLQKEYLPHFENVLYILNERFNRFWLHIDFIYNWSPLKKQAIEDMKYVNNLTDSVGKMQLFVDLLLTLAKDNTSFTDEQIRSETNTFIAGGHDTSTATLAIAISLLGSHPEVQERAYKEILEVIGDSERDVDKDDLTKLVYIEAILKETLRLFPIAPMIVRQLEKDIKLKNYTLKANTACFLSIYGLNRHKIWGSDANEFRPERWLDKYTIPESKYHASFGMGRRTCIGKTYALMGMKIVLAHVLKKYNISSDVSNIVVRMDIMIRPESGHHITLQRRSNY